MKKLLLLFLALVMTLSLAACGGKNDDPKESGTTPPAGEDSTQSDTGETEDPNAVCDLPAELRFDGEVFTFAVYENVNVNNNMLPTEEPDTINQALEQRRYITEERLGVKLNQVTIRETIAASRIPILNDSAEFDITNVRCTHGLALWQEGLVIASDTLPYIDVEKDYWNKSFNDTLALNGINYVYIGDMMMSTYDLTYALLFNKKMHAEYSLDSIYDLVNQDKWTIEAMYQMMEQVTSPEEEIYGYAAHYKNVLPNFWIAAGEMSVKKDEDDMPYLAMGEENFMNVIERVFEITWGADTYLAPEDDMISDIPPDLTQKFIANKSLFIDTSFYYIQQMRQSETDFGIIPYPKFTEEQSRYYSRVSYYNSPMVPITNDKLEMTGAVLEYFNYASREVVVPEYYDRALRGISVRDEESQEMLDLIFVSRVVDIGDTMLCDKIRDDFVWTNFKAQSNPVISQNDIINAELVVDALVSDLMAMGSRS